jgi:outer membrane receptor protein involved in Fe transport
VVQGSGGDPLPGVPVTVRSASRPEAARTSVTDLKGRFRFQLLPPATDYFLLVNYPGFATTEVGPIDLDAGKTTIQDIELRLTDELTERIEVTAHGNIVDTQSTRSSTTFNTEFVEGLPIIGRSYTDILTLTPGVTDTDGDGNPNVQGARDTGLQYRLDGSNITDPASGTFGQNLSIDAIEEIEVITGGAGAEYGRADGGFANIITKSGGNEIEGSFRVFWRGRIFDGNGAGENNDTFHGSASQESSLRDVGLYVTLGGALRRDKLWYFASYQGLDIVDPQNIAGFTITRTARGHSFFGKLTWQVDSDNKLSLQYNEDPREQTGAFLDIGDEARSDALLETGARTMQLRWTAIVSPTLLLEASLGRYDGGVAVTPDSDLFHEISIDKTVIRTNNLVRTQAQYPARECASSGANCDPRSGNPSIYQIDNIRGQTSGPYPFRTDDLRIRNSIRTDLTYTLEDKWGEHQLKSGLEFADEKFEDSPLENPFFLNNYQRCEDLCQDIMACPEECKTGSGGVRTGSVLGFQVLSEPRPYNLDQKATSFNSSLYLQDVWKPVPNLTIQAGLRLDRENVDTSGFTFFNPRDEKRRSIAIVEALCSDGVRVANLGSGMSNAGSSLVCDDPTRVPGDPPKFNLKYWFDFDTPSSLRQYDTNLDGIFDEGVDGSPWFLPFSVYEDREPENFEIQNINLSPRFSIAWDPWADGRTKVFSTWGRYYDRLFLDTVDDEIGPDLFNYTFLNPLDPVTQLPTAGSFGPSSLSSAESAATVTQVDRDLRTPFTDVFTFGIEREIAPEWSVKLTYTQRLAWDLLQDVDLNHVLCVDHPREFNIKKTDVCPLFTRSDGKIIIDDDRFGTIQTGKSNLAPDLYIVNRNFNQILRVGNYNNANYKSIALEILRRLHRNWQAQISYTWSRVYGQAEDFLSTLGNDPSTTDDEQGFLDYDQRHRAIFIATARLPRDIEVGTSIRWESGTPYSVAAQVVDQDNDANVAFRTFFPTEHRNDQRNGSFWKVDLKSVKRFNIADTAASASLAINNIFNDDDATLSVYRTSSTSGVQLVEGPQGLRRFGRYWELGFSIEF